MLSYLITEGNFSINFSQIFENAYYIASTNEYILNPNEIIDISRGIILNTDGALFLKIDPELEQSLDIIGKDHFELKEKKYIKIKNKTNNAIKIKPYHPLIHIASCNSNCKKYKFNLISSHIEPEIEQTINELIDNVVKTTLLNESKEEVEPVIESKEEVENVIESKEEVVPVIESKEEVENVIESKEEVVPVIELVSDSKHDDIIKKRKYIRKKRN